MACLSRAPPATQLQPQDTTALFSCPVGLCLCSLFILVLLFEHFLLILWMVQSFPAPTKFFSNPHRSGQSWSLPLLWTRVYPAVLLSSPSPLLCHELFQGKGPAFPTSESGGSSTDSVLPKLESGIVHLCCLKLCRELYLPAFLHLIWFPSSSYRLAGNICNVLLIGALRSRKKKKNSKMTHLRLPRKIATKSV